MLRLLNDPTPAGWTQGGTLLAFSGPCLSRASWSAPLRVASLPSNEARRGVNGFGSFCLHNKGRAPRDASGKTSATGPRPGINRTHTAPPSLIIRHPSTLTSSPLPAGRPTGLTPKSTGHACELGRPSVGLRRHDALWLHGASMVLATFGKRKGTRRTGAKPRQILKHPISSIALAIRYAFTPNTPPTNIHEE